MNLPSLQEYWLVEQDRCEIEVFRKSENWASTYYVAGDTITSYPATSHEGINLTVAEVYESVENQQIIELLASLE